VTTAHGNIGTRPRARHATALLAALLAVSVLLLAGCPARRPGTPTVLDPTMLDRA